MARKHVEEDPRLSGLEYGGVARVEEENQGRVGKQHGGDGMVRLSRVVRERVPNASNMSH